MRTEFVFPQTITDDPNFLRAGGLTKRELFAAMILAGNATATARYAVVQADRLIDALKIASTATADDLPFTPSE